ncbi:MFS transporter [Treponema primitia]|uniref:MFS transporter n=1 Tax=Treponema primitia TaxID=88058 RepID=UPI00025551A1|nr:MFS transporter [Treponema primitia]
MATFLLCVIYLTFISLGLPDSLLGSAWPVMHRDFGVPLYFAGLASAAITGSTVISSLFSHRVIQRFGTSRVTLVSVTLTAAGLLGFSFMPSFFWFFFFALPLGLGGGAIDTGLNNFVALHYKARHMNWLHCFWGIGAGLSPVIMSWFISQGDQWRHGYRTISLIQWSIVLVLAATLFLWKPFEIKNPDITEKTETKVKQNIFRIPGVKAALLAFFSYVSLEGIINIWGPTYLVMQKGVGAHTAAQWLSLYFMSLTVGRFISGLVSAFLSNKNLIFLGCLFVALGIILLALPLPQIFSFFAFLLIGFGYAPVFPSMLHETPRRFGMAISQAIMGWQFAVSYIGTSLTPMFTGLVISRVSMNLYPCILALCLTLLVGSTVFIGSLEKQGKLVTGD